MTEDEEGPLSVRNRPRLIVLAGNQMGEVIPLRRGQSIMGRGSKVAIRLEDEGISRRHASLIVRGNSAILCDLASANGSRVNGKIIKETELRDGDKIRLGPTTVLKFAFTDELDDVFQRTMYNAALRDGLTKVFNKTYFLQRLESEFAYAKRHAAHLGLIMFDVDHFKQVNDTYGHLAGDHVLAQCAQRIDATLRTEDVLARYGGEEFSVVCRGIPLPNVAALAERLRCLVESETFSFADATINVRISLGVAGYAEVNPTSPAEFIAAADAALLTAKREGRNRVVVAR